MRATWARLGGPQEARGRGGAPRRAAGNGPLHEEVVGVLSARVPPGGTTPPAAVPPENGYYNGTRAEAGRALVDVVVARAAALLLA